MWNCPKCAAKVDDNFDICWQCGASFDGEVHPDFVPETDAGVVPEDWVPLIRCESCGYRGKVLLKRVGYRWWMWVVSIVIFPVALFLNLAFIMIANARVRRCPRCDADNRLHDSADVPSSESELLWQTATAADEEQFRKGKLLMLLQVVILLGVVLVLTYLMRTNG